MKRIVPFLSILTLILAMTVSVASAQPPEPPTPLPLKEGAVTGYMEHTVTVTIGEDGAREEGERGRLEETVYWLVISPALDQRVNWTLRSSLQYYDHDNWEDVQGNSDNWTDTPVYRLQVTGELDRNGYNLWSNTVSSGPNTTYVSSGYSPWYTGYNAFWQSKGDHLMWVTSGSSPESGNTEVSHQF